MVRNLGIGVLINTVLISSIPMRISKNQIS